MMELLLRLTENEATQVFDLVKTFQIDPDAKPLSDPMYDTVPSPVIAPCVAPAPQPSVIPQHPIVQQYAEQVSAPIPQAPLQAAYAAPTPALVPPMAQPVPTNIAPPMAAPQVAPVQVAPVVEATAALPTAATTFSLEDLSNGARQLVDAQRIGEVQALLAVFGVQALNQLAPEHYGNFAMHLRSKGVKI